MPLRRRSGGPLGSVIDPGTDQLDLSRRERRSPEWHPGFPPFSKDACHQAAALCVSWSDHTHCQAAIVESELREGLYRPMTLVAGVLEDRLDITFEVDFARRGLAWACEEGTGRGDECNAKAEPDWPHDRSIVSNSSRESNTITARS